MRVDRIDRIDVSTNTIEWLRAKYIAVDSMNSEGYSFFLAEDCTMQFGNNPIVQGKIAIINGILMFWDSIAGLEHSFTNIIGSDFHFTVEALIDYKRKDGNVVTVPCVTSIKRNANGKVCCMKIFLDLAPVFK